MAKYIRKSPTVVEAVQYNLGMEDGVRAYEFFSNKYIGEFKKGDAYPKVSLRPYRYSQHGLLEYFNWGDYLVIYENKPSQWISKNDFEQEYILLA
ncbi:hypothetical protein [Paenibacillus lautus]|uniref:hypothetical protein n=1 Tax=Paenibacillus lautus TaxID=1401 RepID=UPI001C7DA18C|nr:hypothetical protein [Paenibacillus lautus]MBX4152432.1 hypothetical protein [Paenibacillus lautus]